MLTILGAAVVLFVFFAAQHVQTGTHPDAFAYIEEEQLTQQENPMPETAYTVEIMVHVAGAVQKPGVYTLEQGQRVEDALQNRSAVTADSGCRRRDGESEPGRFNAADDLAGHWRGKSTGYSGLSGTAGKLYSH